VLYIVTGSRWSMGATSASVIEMLEAHANAEVIELNARRPQRGVFVSRFRTALVSFNPRLLRLRNRLTEDDSVFVIGWYLIPLLLLFGLRVVPRPTRLVSLATFLHDPQIRRATNSFLRVFKGNGLEFIVFSDAERRNLVGEVGISPDRVHRLIYRGVGWREMEPDQRGDYIFTGGHTHRDYGTFFEAVAPLQHHVVAAASPLNDLANAPPNVDVRVDIPLAEFEKLVAGCALLVLPLHAGGEACGQTVLVSGIRHKRPIIATFHDSLIDYLGHDYPGFVPARDAKALRAAIARALSDEPFKALLLERVDAAARMLREMGGVEDEFLRILLRNEPLTAKA
jgi:glycosyltransferase involved in cell wall biosynthesis